MRTKEEKIALEKKGITILRSQFNQHKQKWMIVKHTPKGGWEVYKNDTFETQEAAESMIDWFERQFPDRFCKD